MLYYVTHMDIIEAGRFERRSFYLADKNIYIELSFSDLCRLGIKIHADDLPSMLFKEVQESCATAAYIKRACVPMINRK